MAKKSDPRLDPSTTSAAYDAMVGRWHIIDTLLGGTEAMREAGQSLLPQHPEEETKTYEQRLAATTLLNMFEVILEGLVGKPFETPVQRGEDIPPEVDALLDDVDLQGNNIDVFGRRWFREGLAKGFAHVLADFPRPQPREDGRPRTLADDKSEGLRPYWVLLPPENVFFMHAETRNGQEFLTHVRIHEETTEMDGFAEVRRSRIRVLTPGMVQLYELRRTKNRREEWVKVDEWETKLDYIPLRTFYSVDRDALALARPPLMDVAHLNVTHWQSSSDQRHVLTISRFPMLAVSGAIDENNDLRVGPNQWLHVEDPQGKFYYVEHTGAAIEAGAKDLEDLVASMSHYGAEFLRKRPGNSTATARALDSAEAASPLQTMVLNFVDVMGGALDDLAAWLGQDGGGSVSLKTDFDDIDEVSDAELKALTDARTRRDISRLAWIEEMRRRGVIDEDFDAEADKEALDEEEELPGGDLTPGEPEPPQQE